jgi:hypothetical protein
VCEGQCERAYVRWLERVANEVDQKFTFDTYVAGGGGFAKQATEAIKYADQEKKRGQTHRMLFMLTDDDKMGESDQDTPKLQDVEKRGFSIVFQQPNFEGLLLAHFEHAKNVHSDAVVKRLTKYWPGYSKNRVDAKQLTEKLSIEKLREARKQYSELDKICKQLGL